MALAHVTLENQIMAATPQYQKQNNSIMRQRASAHSIDVSAQL